MYRCVAIECAYREAATAGLYATKICILLTPDVAGFGWNVLHDPANGVR